MKINQAIRDAIETQLLADGWTHQTDDHDLDALAEAVRVAVVGFICCPWLYSGSESPSEGEVE
ncbi:hypothetical protein E2F47_22130 [Mycobacterium eburneum]|nr:hypothetical protein [Mycobacterium eburneum]TDH48866.1 hypothetical protein E2F47_22130 [Mycobacterium eburneum]